MPATLTYPGVYIEEIPSGVHTITGVATSIAAFVGWAPQGPVTKAVLVVSWSDFARQFGELDSRSYLGYAVNQFFGNGGQQAYIVRLAWMDALTASAASVGGTLNLWASSPGQWVNNFQIVVTIQPGGSLFNIKVQDTKGNVLETFLNLSVTSAVAVIDNDSQFITFADPSTGNPPASIGMPAAGTGTLTGGSDGTVLQPNDGNFETVLDVASAISTSPPPPNSTGLQVLNRVDIFNLLCIPGESDPGNIGNLEQYCWDKRALYIVDSPQIATTPNLNTLGPAGVFGGSLTALVSQPHPENAAYYYPWVQAPDPLAKNKPRFFPPSGFVAGIYASTDASRGVWKAPAGTKAGLAGVSGLQYVLTDLENGLLNVQAINCLRQFKVYGDVVWGARTLGGQRSGGLTVEVRSRFGAWRCSSSPAFMTAPSGWSSSPMTNLSGARFASTWAPLCRACSCRVRSRERRPQKAYFVKCDAENNPQSSIDQGIVNILVGFAPLFPAEFVVIQIQQMAGQLQT